MKFGTNFGVSCFGRQSLSIIIITKLVNRFRWNNRSPDPTTVEIKCLQVDFDYHFHPLETVQHKILFYCFQIYVRRTDVIFRQFISLQADYILGYILSGHMTPPNKVNSNLSIHHTTKISLTWTFFRSIMNFGKNYFFKFNTNTARVSRKPCLKYFKSGNIKKSQKILFANLSLHEETFALLPYFFQYCNIFSIYLL